ncbi:MAG: radical SAM protein, partial [Anaerolineae bacterium]
CQNWLTSQTLRDPEAGLHPRSIRPEEMIALARRFGAKMVASSYNEPLITSEWAVDIFKLARNAGLRTAFVSNGNATREVLEYLRPWTDCYKIDLKSMSDRNYRSLGGVLDHVLRTIEMVHDMGFWMEIVTLVVPGWNDSDEELRQAAEFIAGISRDIPWHVTAFHKDYKMHDPANTTIGTLLRAAEIGREAGLHYVYAGNLPGRVGRWENTYCPNCNALLVERYGYLIRQRRVTPAGDCPDCGQAIAGVWE